jgi:hypothetical protein
MFRYSEFNSLNTKLHVRVKIFYNCHECFTLLNIVVIIVTRLFQRTQTSSGTQPAFYLVGTGGFLRRKSGQGVKLTSYLLQVPRLRKTEAIPRLHHMPSFRAHRQIYLPVSSKFVILITYFKNSYRRAEGRMYFRILCPHQIFSAYNAYRNPKSCTFLDKPFSWCELYAVPVPNYHNVLYSDVLV